uniref:DUF1740-domain-containing protein n=1 Tax=Coccidioides posadasii RMSCC 3488 TaxID=454284 RepID=A0A0J6FM65_COCPO|nr:hypothetical protein CPAG_07775 [Coccidioides posadasii RMSCC 3488]
MESREGKGKPAIPRFASFKPKPQRPSEQPEAKREDTEHEGRDSTRHSHRSDHKEEHSISTKSSDRKTRAPLAASREDRRDRESSRYNEHKEPEQHRADIFKIDKRGDKYNVEYGSPHLYDIPSYHRTGAGRVLGLPTDYTIDRELSFGTKIVIRPRGSNRGTDNGRQRYNSSLWKRASRFKEFRRVRPVSQAPGDLESESSFISLSASGGSKRRRVDNKASSEDSGPDYRSIEGKAKPTDSLALDLDMTSDSDIESEEVAARRRNASLSAHVSVHPDDINGWLDLISHQGSMVGTADSEGHRTYTMAEKKSIADIKISMYERALNKIPHNAPRDRLLLGMMEEGATIWDTKILLSKWKSVLQLNPGYITLWVKYLDFQQTRFVNFTYENCRSIFLECLRINQTHCDNLNRGVVHLYIILRLSLFMREAGYFEHAVALWQATLEFNFCGRAVDIKNNLPNAVRSFSEFWDSEMPRLGEVGAKGWNSNENEPPASKSDPPIANIDMKAIFDSWGKLERRQMRHSRLPARTLDEVQEDDPYRVILSSDIQDFLTFFSEPGLLDLLLDAFLLFCHLPPHSSRENAHILKEWREDPFIRNLILEQEAVSSQWFRDPSHEMDEPDLPTPVSLPYSNFAVTHDTIFSDGSSWFSAFKSWRSTYVDDTSSLDAPWVRRTLRQLVECVPENDTLAEYSVGLEYICNPSDAAKYAKSLLRKRPSSITLYNAYALIERRRGQEIAAEKVWMTTLSMSKSFPEEVRKDSIMLWQSWLWEALRSNDAWKAIRLLIALPENAINVDELSRDSQAATGFSPAEFLKTQRVLVEAQNYGLSFRNSTVFISNTECLALLHYLTRTFEIESALSIYRAAEERLKDSHLEQTPLAELLHQSKAKLLWYHVSNTMKYKPALVREELSNSLSLFPNNSIFLSIFAYNESRFRIDDRVRLILRQHISSSSRRSLDGNMGTPGHSPLTPHFFSIYSELHRGVSAGSTAHSVRAAFETAVSSPPGQYSAAIWKLYILFELGWGRKERARDVFYRSIRSCPWVKELVLLAFTEPGLKEMMGADELRKIWNVPVEKGLRIHVDLEDVLEEMDDEKSISGQSAINPSGDQSSDGEM